MPGTLRPRAGSAHSDVDVIVAGCGPVGVSAALLLARAGIRTAVIERDRAIYPRARAVTVNDWTMRIFQGLGLDHRLKADMTVNGALHWKTYAGREVFRLGIPPSSLGHPGSLMIYQPLMEATLREALAGQSDVVDVRFGEEVTGVEQDDSGVTATVRDVDDGTQRTIRGRYLLACDGGSSRIRAGLGVTMTGTTQDTDWIVVDAEVLRWWPGCHELVFWADPERPVVDIPLAKGNHRWEFPLRQNEDKAVFDSDEAIWNLLTPMGITPQHVRLKNHAFYVHHLRRAEKWRVGKVLLLGDAAHLMPPWAGQGMQSGIRDADNVVWKLREVLAGRLSESVLDTYQPEREPHVAGVTDLSIKMGMLIASQDTTFIRMRNTLGPLIMRVPGLVRALLPSTEPALDAGWLRGQTGKHSALGRMIPQPDLHTANGQQIRLDDALGHGFAVLGRDIDPRARLGSAEVAGWEALGARFVAIRPGDGSAADEHDLVDDTGQLIAWMQRYRAQVIAVRPDRFVAATDAGGLALPSTSTAGQLNPTQTKENA